ncbi:MULTISPECIES: DUF305 domain-containing protein [Nocardia]|uniref:DUF305 domain-containing protein n=1 Tax=Nocardia TaxID=1817 RepID=UPI0002D33385|nr:MULTISPECIES: DUF305 domain-containing protein [Nocardia]
MTLDAPVPDNDARPDPPSVSRWSRPRLPVRPALLAALAAAVMLGVGVGWQISPRPDLREHTVVDVGFAQDMSAHHGQAVEMSALAMARTDDPEIRTLAYDVVTTQQSQIGTMQGWLSLWEQPASAPGAVMTWMRARESGPSPSTHDMANMTATAASAMPGMAGPEELRRLRQSSGPAADVLYLQLLLRHHQGGLAMARYARDNAGLAAVARLAETILTTQTAESDTIGQLLDQRGTTPLPAN